MSRYSLLLGLAVALCCTTTSLAAEPIGQVIGAVGGASIERPGVTEPIAAAPGIDVYAEDVLVTDHSGRLKIFSAGKMVLQLGSNTRLRVTSMAFDATAKRRQVACRLQSGSMRLLVLYVYDLATEVRVETPGAVAESKAAYFVLSYEPAARRTEALALAGVVGLGVGSSVGPLLNAGALGVAVTGEAISLPTLADDATRERLLSATDVPNEGLAENRLGGPQHLADRPAPGMAGEDALGGEGMPAAQGGEAGTEFDAFREAWSAGGLAQEDLPGRRPPDKKPDLLDLSDRANVDVTIGFPDSQGQRLRPRTRR